MNQVDNNFYPNLKLLFHRYIEGNPAGCWDTDVFKFSLSLSLLSSNSSPFPSLFSSESGGYNEAVPNGWQIRLVFNCVGLGGDRSVCSWRAVSTRKWRMSSTTGAAFGSAMALLGWSKLITRWDPWEEMAPNPRLPGFPPRQEFSDWRRGEEERREVSLLKFWCKR